MHVIGRESRILPVTQEYYEACDDDESRTCLTPEEGAPLNCAAYKANGGCGTQTYDLCCKHTCGFCPSFTSEAIVPPNLACLLDHKAVPFEPLDSKRGRCMLPPSTEGMHSLRATLLSIDFHHAFSEIPPVNATEPLPVRYVDRVAPDFPVRAVNVQFVPSSGGMPVRIDGVNSAIVAWCRFGEAMELTPEALETCEEEWYLRDASMGLTYCSIAPMNRIVPATPVSDTGAEWR